MPKNKNRKLKRELRKAKSDLSALVQYLSDCEEIFLEYQKEWNQDLKIILSHFETKKTFEEKEERTELFKSSNFFSQHEEDLRKTKKDLSLDTSPGWVKKLFRKIAMATHPDKTAIESLNSLYNDAAEMVESKDYQGLFKICDNLGINYEVDPETELKLNREKQEKIKKRLKEIDKNFAWIWGESYGMVDLRISFLSQVLNIYKISNIEEIKIREIIENILE